MTTPEGQKKIWKHIDWKDGKEKLAFFNHYFKNDDILKNMIREEKKRIRGNLLEFIQEGVFKDDKGNNRPVNMNDVVNELKGD